MSGTPATERPHAPLVGWSQRLFGAIHVTGVFWFSGTYRFLAWAPDWLVRLTVAVFTGGFFLALLRIRVAIAANLEPVLGPCGFIERQRRIFRTMYSFAWCYTERYQYLHAPEKFTIRAEGREHLEAAGDPGVGIVFVTAHVGHWESASHLMPASLDRQVHVVREEELDPRAQAFMQELLSRHGQARYKTHFATDDPRLGILLVQALRRGDVVALQGDRPRAAGRSLTATLFSRPMALPAGPAALARAASVSLVPVFGFRTGPRSYAVCLREPIRVATEGDRDAAIQEATRRLAREIEWAIAREPHQWFCFRRLWSPKE
jgi:lauroyl/myristoyl acyltransferase